MSQHTNIAGAQGYQFAHDAGKKRAADWFAQHGHSLAVFRDHQRASFLLALNRNKMPDYMALCTSFDAGFAEGLAAFIAGGRHD